MIETEMQKLLIDAAKSVGGQGLKLNNRFLVGVVDLLIKIPDRQPFWLEAKKIDLSQLTVDTTNHIWTLDVTQRQKAHLRDWTAAGMLCGVASFVQIKGQGVKGLQLCLYTYADCVVNEWRACVLDHEPLGDHRSRTERLVLAMQEFGLREK